LSSRWNQLVYLCVKTSYSVNFATLLNTLPPSASLQSLKVLRLSNIYLYSSYDNRKTGIKPPALVELLAPLAPNIEEIIAEDGGDVIAYVRAGVLSSSFVY
jgi:hypothetical protein